MTKTGPQKYPGASTAYWFGSRYEGASMEINACVWHTTEGTTLPTYGGGTSAPTITAVPDFDAKKLRWYQHFDIEQSARALVDAAGGITTNRNNLAQVELVGTCDPATHRKWQAAGRQHIYWPEAPDWALREVAEFVRWLNANHGVPMTSTVPWRAYPGSYGTQAPQRLSSAAFNAYKGHLGHQHVPEGNDHGDPGDIDFVRIIQLAKGETEPPVPQEDDMPTAQEIADAVWAKQLASPTAPQGTDPNRSAGTFLRWADVRHQQEMTQLAALSASVEALARLVGQDVDTEQVVAAVQQAIADAVIQVSVDVNTPKES